MKTKNLLLAAAALMVLTACSSEDSPIEPTEERVPVRLGNIAVDAAETRAAQHLNEGTLEAGERVMVRISNTGANSWTDYTYMTYVNGGMIAPDPCPYYPEGGQHIDIVAYLPATAGTSFTIAADQIADADFKASELLFASVTDQAKQDEPVKLAFTHKMAKICANVTAGEGIGSIKGISVLNVRPTVSFNQVTGEVGEATGEPISIAMSNNGAAVIPEQTISGTILAVETDKGTANYDANDVFFEAGYSYTANITVNLHALGTTTSITNWTKTGTLTVNPVVAVDSDVPAGVEAVDLGLSVKWANMNIGATKETDYGTYFAWGETTDKTYYYYSWDNYAWCRDGDHDLMKYCPYNYGFWFGDPLNNPPDNKKTLDLGDDAARANWGGNWRMPTDKEWRELITQCTWTWEWRRSQTILIHGTETGVRVTGKNGNSIFLPATSTIVDNFFESNRDFPGIEGDGKGFYWSSSLCLGSENHSGPFYAHCAKFEGKYSGVDNTERYSFDVKDVYRFQGCTVRAVKP